MPGQSIPQVWPHYREGILLTSLGARMALGDTAVQLLSGAETGRNLTGTSPKPAVLDDAKETNFCTKGDDRMIP